MGRCMNPKEAKRCSKRVSSELKGMSGLGIAPQAISPVATLIRAWHICRPTCACCICEKACTLVQYMADSVVNLCHIM